MTFNDQSSNATTLPRFKDVGYFNNKYVKISMSKSIQHRRYCETFGKQQPCTGRLSKYQKIYTNGPK